MPYEGYRLIGIVRDGAIVFATLDNPPINLVTLELFGELTRLSQDVEADPDALVLVLRSANPYFFIAHFDVNAILGIAIDRPATREGAGENPYHAMCARFADMDKVTIAQIEGRIGGGGSELAMAFDMRIGAIGKTVLNQMEVPIGILPGGGGTQRLPRIVGRARALEIILGGEDVDAPTLEAWGYLNRALPAEDIGSHVEALARRIAAFPPEAVRQAKQSVRSGEVPMDEGLAEESHLFQRLIRTEAARRNMTRFLEIGGQTPEGETRIADLSGELAGG